MRTYASDFTVFFCMTKRQDGRFLWYIKEVLHPVEYKVSKLVNITLEKTPKVLVLPRTYLVT